MEFVKLIVYSLFFATAVFLVMFNVLYSFRIYSANYRLGFSMPRFLKRALEINVLIAFTVAVIIALVLANTLASIRIPAIL